MVPRSDGEPVRRARAGSFALQLLSILMLGAALGGQHLLLPAAGLANRPFSLPWWALAAAFALSEVAVVHLPAQRQTHTVSLSELPLMLGLAFAAPHHLVLGRVVGSALAVAFHRRLPPAKLLFNVSLFYLEAVVAILAYRAVLGGVSPASPSGWLAGFVALIAAVLLSAALVNTAIALLGTSRKAADVARSFATGSIISAAVAYVGVLVVAMLWHDVRMAGLLVALAALFLGLFRVYGALSRRHDDLRAVYTFTAELDGAAALDDVTSVVLAQCRALLRAENAEVVLLDDHGAPVQRLWLDHEDALVAEPVGRDDVLAAVVAATAERPGAIVFDGDAGDPVLRSYYGARGLRSGAVIRVDAAGRPLALLVVGNRLGPERRFSSGDLELLATFARHTSLTLERAQVVERLRREIAAKQAAIRSKDELIAAVSHELRTPLTGVLGFAELLRDGGYGLTDDDRQELIATIAGNAHDLGDIVDDLLVAAREDLGVLSVDSRPVPLATEVEMLLEMARSRWDRNIEVDLRPVTARADAHRLRQILRNLIENAVRYGGERVVVRVEEHGGVAHVVVSDNGNGVPAGQRERVFGAYQSAHTFDTQPSSVGVGLSLSRGLARRMGGDLSYDYRGGWSHFDVTLPLAS